MDLHSLSSNTSQELYDIAHYYFKPQSIISIKELGSGNINDTYLVQTAQQQIVERFVMQKMNNSVFQFPVNIQKNTILILEHLERSIANRPCYLNGKSWKLFKFLESQANKQNLICKNGNYWRMFSYIDNSYSLNKISLNTQAYETGIALATFHMLLTDFPSNSLDIIIPDFHNTNSYLEQYYEIYKKQSFIPTDSTGLAVIHSLIDSKVDLVSHVSEAMKNDNLSISTIHQDPKVSNFLFDCELNQIISVIDLDTVGKGFVVFDICDCARSVCNPYGEELTKPIKAKFDTSLFNSFLRGYLSISKNLLTNGDYLFFSNCLRIIPFELGLRFLNDHLTGNNYFKVDYHGQNKERAEVQFSLLASIDSKIIEIQHILTSAWEDV